MTDFENFKEMLSHSEGDSNFKELEDIIIYDGDEVEVFRIDFCFEENGNFISAIFLKSTEDLLYFQPYRNNGVTKMRPRR